MLESSDNPARSKKEMRKPFADPEAKGCILAVAGNHPHAKAAVTGFLCILHPDDKTDRYSYVSPVGGPEITAGLWPPSPPAHLSLRKSVFGDCITRGGVTQQPKSVAAGGAEARARDQGPRCAPREGEAGQGPHMSGASDPHRHARPPGGSEEPVMVSAAAALGSPEGS